MTEYVYPHTEPDPRGGLSVINHSGMTLRDWFAGQAINGLCADPSNHKMFESAEDAALSAYAIADAMMAARNNTNENKGE